ncbi:protein of unknown function [Candidatus Promineifilum breve]|uniref:Uncharacterized protein n=1 Tax=Candidatus Promineifilum breve TaxID=1806508 RepID=A0A160T859_9CHLR|nr:hypothetical protein [Candidatus Promineifilum breve]CUS06212.1 protein of unknown function [Candidatus Promineifilum breve]
MNLTEAYSSYLKDPANSRALNTLQQQLEQGGYHLEASLLHHYAVHGSSQTVVQAQIDVWQGRKAFVGPLLPVNAMPGDLWFDTCEISAMIMLPAESLDPRERYAPSVISSWSPLHGWMSLRPVANWQFAVFLMHARLVPRVVQLPPPFLILDMGRLLKGRQEDPVTDSACSEAGLYTRWLGKGLCDLSEWQAALRLLGEADAARLWGPLQGEWGGNYDEEVCAVIRPTDFKREWLEIEDETGISPERRTFFSEWQIPPQVGLRTRVLSQFGLIQSPGNDPSSMLNVDLVDVLPRNRTTGSTI